MAESVLMAQSRAIPVDPETACARTLVVPLPDLFRRRYGPIPAIKAVRGDEPWQSVGQRCTIALAGGGGMTETLIAVDPPTVSTTC